MMENLDIEYGFGLSPEIVADIGEYVDNKHVMSVGEDCIVLQPKKTQPATIDNCHLKNMHEMYSETKFNEKRDPPVIVGTLKHPDDFNKLSNSCLDVLLKVGGEDTYHLPTELLCLQEVVQMAVDYFHSNHPDAKDYYCYMSPTSCAMPINSCQRYKAIHADGLLGTRHRDANGVVQQKCNYLFSVFNTLPTEYFMQSLDVSQLDVAKHDYTKFFNKNVSVDVSYPHLPYQVAMSDAYTLHRSPINTTGAELHRIFVNFDFVPYMFDGERFTINRHFIGRYPTTLMHYPRRTLSSKHPAALAAMDARRGDPETQARRKTEEMKRKMALAVASGGKKWNRSKIMLVGEGRAGKTALANSMIGRKFTETESTVGINNLTCNVNMVQGGSNNWSSVDKPQNEFVSAIAEMMAKPELAVNTDESSPPAVVNDAPVNAAAAAVAELGDEVIMKAYNEKIGKPSGLVLSVFDYGGQSVFGIVHHLFLTRCGVYVLVFNINWLLSDDRSVAETCLNYMRYWLNSIVIHTMDSETSQMAPIYLVGSHRDRTSMKSRKRISTLLVEAFHQHVAWPSVVQPEYRPEDKANRIYLEDMCFFPVDNSLSSDDPVVQVLMAAIENQIKDSVYTQQLVPLTWLKTVDDMQVAQKSCFQTSEVKTLLTNNGAVDDQEFKSFLHFLNEMGMALYQDEPGFNDIVIWDAISYLVDPATMVICQHVGDSDDKTVHMKEEHTICKNKYFTEWKALIETGILSEKLLPVLWKSRQEQQSKLVMLMNKYGLMLPICQTEEEEKLKVPRKFLVPALLRKVDLKEPLYTNWAKPGSYRTCYFVFTAMEVFTLETTFAPSELRLFGFLSGGTFERIVGSAVSWCQATSRKSQFQLRDAVIHHNVVELHYGSQRFRLTLLADLNCIRLDVEGEYPLAVHARLVSQINQIIQDMKMLHYFTALMYNPNSTEECQESDYAAFASGASNDFILIPLHKLSAAVDSHTAVNVTGGKKFLSEADIKARYRPWLRLHELLPKYDVFISYRWSPDDKVFATALFDSFSNFTVDDCNRGPDVFLDQMRLMTGRRFDTDFAKALMRTNVVVPLVSLDALKKMSEHDASAIDNLLLEWIIAQEQLSPLSPQAKCKALLPIIFGERNHVNTENGVELVVNRFDKMAVVASLPETVPTATLNEALRHFSLNGATVRSEESFKNQTVRQIVSDLLNYLYFDASSEKSRFLVASATEQAIDVLTPLLQIKDVSIPQPSSGTVAAVPVTTTGAGDGNAAYAQSKFYPAWQIMFGGVYAANKDQSSMKVLLDELGISSPDDLDGLDEEFVVKICELLKPVQASKLKKLLSV